MVTFCLQCVKTCEHHELELRCIEIGNVERTKCYDMVENCFDTSVDMEIKLLLDENKIIFFL